MSPSHLRLRPEDLVRREGLVGSGVLRLRPLDERLRRDDLSLHIVVASAVAFAIVAATATGPVVIIVVVLVVIVVVVVPQVKFFAI